LQDKQSLLVPPSHVTQEKLQAIHNGFILSS